MSIPSPVKVAVLFSFNGVVVTIPTAVLVVGYGVVITLTFEVIVIVAVVIYTPTYNVCNNSYLTYYVCSCTDI